LRMKIIGLTGSIATGKSFVAEIFRRRNIEVFSSDAAVGDILKEKEVINIIKNDRFLKEVIKNDIIDKELLSNLVFKDLKLLEILENILHPLVAKKRDEFFLKNNKYGILEVPLLFEKNYQVLCDKVITTYCSDKTQIERALRRKNIDKNRLNFIIKRQMPGNIKAKHTDYLVYTDISYEYTEKQIDEILSKEGIK
jgi:dephospho-CoA kinase